MAAPELRGTAVITLELVTTVDCCYSRLPPTVEIFQIFHVATMVDRERGGGGGDCAMPRLPLTLTTAGRHRYSGEDRHQ